MKPIEAGTTLKGETIELIPLQNEHFKELESISADARIWEFLSVNGSTPGRCIQLMNDALLEREKGTQFPFVIYHKKEQRLIGSTRFMEIVSQHKKLEIGWTWLQPQYWATHINPECKMLLLNYCFNVLKVVRVQLKTSEKNIRSQKAIVKIGAQFEGVLRNDLIQENGTPRSSAYFSILNSEWPAAEEKLQQYLESRKS